MIGHLGLDGDLDRMGIEIKHGLMTSCATLGLIATQANADDGLFFDTPAFYGSLFGGVNFLDDSDVSINSLTGVLTSPMARIDFETGFVVGGALGAEFANNWRGEAELAYRRNNVSSYFESSAFSSSLAMMDLTRNGDYVSTLAIMGNIWRDVDINNSLAFHFGGGVGVALAHASLTDVDAASTDVASVDDSTWVFAGQMGAGLDWKMANGWIASLDYRAFLTDDPKFTGVGSMGRTFQLSHQYVSHAVMIGLRVPLSGN